MKPYILYLGNMLEVLDTLEANSIDAVVTDPPYEINFMNKGWDNTGIVFQKETWEKVLRVLKHGGHLLAFNHSRTFHRMAIAIEDAGFQIRDTIMWLYGSGFPKSHDVSKAIDRQFGAEREVIGKSKRHGGGIVGNGTSWEVNPEVPNITAPATDEAKQWEGWGSALKPSYEPIILARKPLDGTIADNTLNHGVGGLNIDECRVFRDKGDTSNAGHRTATFGNQNTISGGDGSGGWEQNDSGRFPANTIHDGSDEVVDLFPNIGNGNNEGLYNYNGKEYTNKDTSMFNGDKPQAPSNYNDNGSAARFFYTSKTSKKDRDEGLESFETKMFHRTREDAGELTGLNLDPKFAPVPRKNIHPTVKPTDLMQYLIRLITPKGGTVLDPFMGSGSTGKAAMIENNERNADYRFIGIELNPEYIDIAAARIDYGINYKENKAVEEEVKQNGENQLRLEL
jgi:site-specific DNA-methyltransferase (adenine-specific)